jgi:hypothetical protein
VDAMATQQARGRGELARSEPLSVSFVVDCLLGHATQKDTEARRAYDVEGDELAEFGTRALRAARVCRASGAPERHGLRTG